MICYNYKSERFNCWATIRLVGKYKFFGWKPPYWEDCKKHESCYKNGYYNTDMTFQLVPIFSIGEHWYTKRLKFVFTWLIFDFGFHF